MKISVDLKTLITLGGIVAMLSGFVYTTTLRLESIETRIEKLEADQQRLQRKLKPRKQKR